VLVALAAAILVPAASASSTPDVALALVPLPKAGLGPSGHTLPLARDSGVVSNAVAASDATGNVTAKQLKRLGRETGYMLDYGDPFRSASGVGEIQTGIERYRSPAAATRALAFWRSDELKNGQLKQFGIDFSLRKLGLAGVGAPHWSYAGTASIKGLKPLHGVDAEVQQGRYLLDVSVSASSTPAAASLVSKLTRRLEQRMQLALAGRLHGRPVQLPRPQQAGPPAHGPKPADMVLTSGDVGSPATVQHRGYAKPKNAFDPMALSVYDQTMTPAGSFPYLSQEVLLGSSQLEAQYFAAIALSGIASGIGNTGKATPVDLGGVGDKARGELLQLTESGGIAYEGLVVLSRGPYLDFLVAASGSALTTADVHGLAQLAAKRLDAGFGG
jgi:hypothetical protein